MHQENVPHGRMSWVEWFTKYHEIGKYFVEVSQDYIEDRFNLYGCREKVGEHFKEAYERITGRFVVGPHSQISKYEIQLYGLIHARFIRTKQGLEMLREKCETEEYLYELCPNVNCRGKCLPVGLSENLGQNLYMFCPYCSEIYYPESEIFNRIDGSAFESSYVLPFIHKKRGDRLAQYPEAPDLRLFGFKVETPEREEDDEEEEDE